MRHWLVALIGLLCGANHTAGFPPLESSLCGDFDSLADSTPGNVYRTSHHDSVRNCFLHSLLKRVQVGQTLECRTSKLIFSTSMCF